MDFFARPSNDRQDSGGSHPPMIGQQAETRIRGSTYLALRDVTCIARGDVLHLQGRLPTQYLKQVAQEIAAGVEGVRHVHNGIEVSRQQDRAGTGRRSKQQEPDRVELNISNTSGEENLP